MSLLSVPLKTIIPLWVTSTNPTLPDGCVPCEGQTIPAGQHDIGGGASSYVVPEMRNRQPLGADRTKAFGVAGTAGDTAGDAPGPGGTGGRHSISLTVNELPNHTHTGTADTQGGHSHSLSTSGGGGHNHGDGDYAFGDGSDVSARGGGYIQATCTTNTTSSAGNHGHTLGGIGTDSSHYGAHTVSIDAPNGLAGVGAGAPFSVMPRYAGVVYVMKVRN